MAGVSAVHPRISFAELCRWPDDGSQYELYDGEVIVVPSPIWRHHRVCSHVEDLLREYEALSGGITGRAPLDIVLSEYDVIQPDVIFFRRERRHLIDMLQTTRVPPDLAVEVLSRSTERRDRGRKMDLLARSGVPEYWIIDPIGNALEVYELQNTSYVLITVAGENDHVESPTLTGLSFEAARLFEE